MGDTAINLMHGDCLDLMPLVPDGSVDAIICDLPYAVTQNAWDCLIPFSDLWAAYKRLLKPAGAVVLTACDPFTIDLINSNRHWYKYRWTWDKRNPTGFLNAAKQPLRVTEDVCIFYDNQCTYNPQKEIRGSVRNKGNYNKPGGSDNYGTFGNTKSANNEYHPTTLLSISNAHKTGGLHPTQKPVALMRYLVETYTNPGETVMDNCFGSGTTALACLQTGRRFIGMEKDAGYFALAQKRLADTTLHMDFETLG